MNLNSSLQYSKKHKIVDNSTRSKIAQYIRRIKKVSIIKDKYSNFKR